MTRGSWSVKRRGSATLPGLPASRLRWIRWKSTHHSRRRRTTEAGETQVKTAIPFKPGDRVRVKEGYFENFEGDVESIDEANGRVTVMINIFRSLDARGIGTLAN